ncbi:formyltetrahydrofolate deformylase [Prolixibacteraceae bacterium]|nr:formyltetrahydrofolate deformylase [Prolixibacteraceae bacterium]
MSSQSAILLLHCPDQPGILARITEFVNNNKGNILYLDQYVNKEEKLFYMRLEWDLANFTIPILKIDEYFNTLFAMKYQLSYEIHFSDKKPRMALFVSKMSHCLFDILARYAEGEWNVDIPCIISNHRALEPIAKKFGIPFHYHPITAKTKAEEEKKEIELLKKHNIDFVVLARYMQILSEDFITHFPNRIINIHHSFLPAFAGAKPYHAAHKRGVKIIGATSHYVTTELDAGPIIAQDVAKISHKDPVQNLVHKGRDLEKIVLSQAVYKHIQHKVLVYNNRTVVFS